MGQQHHGAWRLPSFPGSLCGSQGGHGLARGDDEEIARIVGLPAGTRPFRSMIDFIGDGAAEVTEVAERVREEFARRIGIADLLKAGVCG